MDWNGHEKVKRHYNTNIVTKIKWVSSIHISLKELVRFIWISSEKKMCFWIFFCFSEFHGALSKTWLLTLGSWGNPFFRRTKWRQQEIIQINLFAELLNAMNFFTLLGNPLVLRKWLRHFFSSWINLKNHFLKIKIIFDNVRRILNAHIVETTWRKKMCDHTIEIFSSQDIKREKFQLRNVLPNILSREELIFIFRHISPQISSYRIQLCQSWLKKHTNFINIHPLFQPPSCNWAHNSTFSVPKKGGMSSKMQQSHVRDGPYLSELDVLVTLPGGVNFEK